MAETKVLLDHIEPNIIVFENSDCVLPEIRLSVLFRFPL